MFPKNPALSLGRALWAAVLAASLLISTNGLASPPKGGGVVAGVGQPDLTAEGRDDDEDDDGDRDRDHKGKKAKKDKKGKRGSDEAISDDDFDEMVKYLSGKEKERKRLDALESEAKNERFSTTQAVELIDLFEGDGRVDAAIILYPALTDPQRFHRVLGEFKRTSDRKTICKELELTLDECGDEQPIAVGVVENVPERKTKIEVVKVVEKPTIVAMSDADFKEMVSSFDNASFSDDKLRVIKLTTKSNYFTSAQALEIVKKCDFANEQEDIAVMFYPRLIDQQNFYKVLEGMTFESSKDTVMQKLNL